MEYYSHLRRFEWKEMNASRFLPVERTSEKRLRKVPKMKKVPNHVHHDAVVKHFLFVRLS